MMLPKLSSCQLLQTNAKRLFISAYGFEERSLGWGRYQLRQGKILDQAIIVKYEPEKGQNKIDDLRDVLVTLGVEYPTEIHFNYLAPDKLERSLELKFKDLNDFDEVIIDITAMTKFLMLVCLCKLAHFKKTLRIVYAEAKDYSPSLDEYTAYKEDSSVVAHFPSQGFRKILRAKCLSSIRMQGQPVALIAFTSFNEQLARHILGTISPYRLIFINGKPPRKDYSWREAATQFIHRRLISDYRTDNPVNPQTELLTRSASTLFYDETIRLLEEIYNEFGMFERIIVAATGSKMQTVGLFFSKIIHPDIHIEYPTPDSYFFSGMSTGIEKNHEITVENFSDFIANLALSYQHQRVDL